MPADIRVRVNLAVVRDGRILLVPHYDTDAGSVQWVIPGGQVHFGERLHDAAAREFREETGLDARVTDLLDVSEVVLPQRPYHSITITFAGVIAGGKLAAEADHPCGEKVPRWFSTDEIRSLAYHPTSAVEKALGMNLSPTGA